LYQVRELARKYSTGLVELRWQVPALECMQEVCIYDQVLELMVYDKLSYASFKAILYVKKWQGTISWKYLLANFSVSFKHPEWESLARLRKKPKKNKPAIPAKITFIAKQC
jgi:hypothetical protein